MTVRDLCISEVRSGDGGRRVEVEFDLGQEHHPVHFSGGDAALSPNPESLIACALLPAMRLADRLTIGEEATRGTGAEISERFFRALSTIQDIYHDWDPGLRRVTLSGVTPVRRIRRQGGRVGTFFTGGVDSFYTLLKHQDEITDLLFVHGFDISLESASLRRRTSDMIREVGAFYSKRVVEVETNLPSLLGPYADWALLAHGAALAAVAHLLSADLDKIYVPASRTYARIVPWGTHPLLAPLWSSEALEFVHDGCEATRPMKAALISESEIALRSLRVCFVNPGEAYNCGRCEKCLRTMIALRAVGMLERCTTFDAPLDVRNVVRIDVDRAGRRGATMDNLKALEKKGGEEELCRALRKILNRPRWHAGVKGRLRGAAARYPALERYYRALRKVWR